MVKPKYIITLAGKNVLSIRRIIYKKTGLRQTFISIYKEQPCKVSDIQENVIMTRGAIYNNVTTLTRLELINKISIMNIINRNEKTWDEKESVKKFNNWTDSMNQKTRNYFLGRTNYYTISEFGEQFIEWACKCEGINIKKFDSKENGGD